MEERSVNELYTIIKMEFEPELDVLKSYPIDEPTFPCLIFEYNGSTTDVEHIDTSGEKYVLAGIVTDIFTNGSNRNNYSHEIQRRLDGILSGQYRMTRTTQDITNNFLNKDLRRIRTTYEFRIDDTETIYRR